MTFEEDDFEEEIKMLEKYNRLSSSKKNFLQKKHICALNSFMAKLEAILSILSQYPTDCDYYLSYDITEGVPLDLDEKYSRYLDLIRSRVEKLMVIVKRDSLLISTQSQETESDEI